jgi:hypothetical protein
MRDDLTIALNKRTAHIIATRFHLENERRRNMSRLTEKLQLAGGVANRQSVKIEARADAIIAREAEIEKKTDQAFSPHEAILSEAETALDAVELELTLLSNNPPLEHSTPLPATTDRVTLGPHPDQPEGATAAQGRMPEQTAASQSQGSASASADPRPNGADVLVRAAE